MISTDICITILKNLDGTVDVGISAPKSIPVNRLEVFNKNKIQEKKD
ncbi:carbon storage regulator [Legionella fallonii]